MKIQINVIGPENIGLVQSHDSDWRTARRIMTTKGCNKLEMDQARDDLRSGFKVLIAPAGSINYIEFLPAA